MYHTPHSLAEELRAALCSYIEAGYRISHPAVAAERGQLIREVGVLSQPPYIESTPRFQRNKRLSLLNNSYIPHGLSELIGFDRELWQHQAEAIEAAWHSDGSASDVIVATGTGSGKTETFYVPILADVLREAQTEWSNPQGTPRGGEWDSRSSQWLNARRHETRPSALRAIILYPMNALVNDQLRRLRRMLASDRSLVWQQKHLNGNRIYFGSYTSQTRVPGSPHESNKRQEMNAYLAQVAQQWNALDAKSQQEGFCPRLYGTEMLCRWDMQAAPPDILVTNYSMLEYMLMRPIEASMFSFTAEWLAASSSHIFTLVLDEAHTYTGAKGTEVAYLIRRLYERLNASPTQVRCIATSASLGGNRNDLEERIKNFAADLFAHPQSGFTVVTKRIEPQPQVIPAPSTSEFEAFVDYHRAVQPSTTKTTAGSISNDQFVVASEQLLNDLGVKQTSSAKPIEARLYDAFIEHPRIARLRQLTEHAIDADILANELWLDFGDKQKRYEATAGLITAATRARQYPFDKDSAPLLSSRLHLMFRMLQGLWACMDPDCSKVDTHEGPRPVGKLYPYPTVTCECGARVLEVFVCRICGLLFLGGVPEGDSEDRLWPYTEQLENPRHNYEGYKLVLVENPYEQGTAPDDEKWGRGYRSILTSGRVAGQNSHGAREVWEQPTVGKPRHKCPRCNATGSPEREVIESMRVGGPQAFAAIVEHAFRLQPPRGLRSSSTTDDASPRKKRWFESSDDRTKQFVKPPVHDVNQGRSLLVFSDSRQQAAMLAGQLTYLHARDVFRQLLVVCLNEHFERFGNPLGVAELLDQVFSKAVTLGIDPSFEEVENFWPRFTTDPADVRNETRFVLEAYLRREMADREVGVESLGLGRWVIKSDADLAAQIPAVEPFDKPQTLSLLYAVLRILMGDNLLFPSDLNPDSWHPELVPFYLKRTIVKPPLTSTGEHLVYKADRRNRLTRYLVAVLNAATRDGYDVGAFMEKLWNELLQDVLESSRGNRPGFGIPINRMAFAPMPTTVQVCSRCGYLNTETVEHMCIRCLGRCEERRLTDVRPSNSYYSQLAKYAVMERYPDPFPLRALEHTAQISLVDAMARERYFQRQFINTGPEPEDPNEHRVDILSVTTTMEMGIDIGDLSSVGLHNTPPTVANYQQRAGRAGRRGDALALVLTYARDRSHDQYYFGRPRDIISGQVRIPVLHLENQLIAKRHIRALVLQRFYLESQAPVGKALFGTLGTIDNYRTNIRDQFAQWSTKEEFLKAVIRSGQTVVPQFAEAIKNWVGEIPAEIDAGIANAAGSADLLEVLITQGLLPRYAFPVDLVALWTQEPNRYNRDEEIQRNLQIALSEYAPGSEVIIDGRVHQSIGLYTPYEKSPQYERDGWYAECRTCHNIEYHPASESEVQPPSMSCSVCEAAFQQNDWMSAIRPRGFRTDWNNRRAPKYRGGVREQAGSASIAQLQPGYSAIQGECFYDGRLWLNKRSGQLSMIHRGKDKSGFWICPKCGRNLASINEEHYEPASIKMKCNGRPKYQSVLLHQFYSDVVLLTVTLTNGLSADPFFVSGRAAWLSLGTALTKASAAYLQIDPSELAIGLRPWRQPDGQFNGEIYIYDTLPNGAGYAAEIYAEIKPIMVTARQLLTECTCVAACYNCLQDYSNQSYHPLLDRRLALDLLDFITTGQTPHLSQEHFQYSLRNLKSFALPEYELTEDVEHGGERIPMILSMPNKSQIEIYPIHTLEMPTSEQIRQRRNVIGMQTVYCTEFDLMRRPFWVWQEIVRGNAGVLRS